MKNTKNQNETENRVSNADNVANSGATVNTRTPPPLQFSRSKPTSQQPEKEELSEQSTEQFSRQMDAGFPPAQLFQAKASAHQGVIQREEWDLQDLEDKGSQKHNFINSMAKGAFDKMGGKKAQRFGSVSTKLETVKSCLVNRDAEGLAQALTILQKQFKSGTPPYNYINKRLTELKGNKKAAMNTMAAYHNLRADNQPDPSQSELMVDQMRAYILAAKDAYASGDYQKTDEMLLDNNKAKEFGFYIRIVGGRTGNKNNLWYNSIQDLIQQAMPRLKKAMAMHKEGDEHIKLPYVIPKKGGEPQKQYWEIPELAKMALPIYLEEWMHKYQRFMRKHTGIPETDLTGAFWSQNTADFHAGTVGDYESPLKAAQTVNYNEVDILAAFHDWGFPVEELTTVGEGNIYEGREDFWKWLKTPQEV